MHRAVYRCIHIQAHQWAPLVVVSRLVRVSGATVLSEDGFRRDGNEVHDRCGKRTIPPITSFFSGKYRQHKVERRGRVRKVEGTTLPHDCLYYNYHMFMTHVCPYVACCMHVCMHALDTVRKLRSARTITKDLTRALPPNPYYAQRVLSSDESVQGPPDPAVLLHREAADFALEAA